MRPSGNDLTYALASEFTIGPEMFATGSNVMEFRWQGAGVTDAFIAWMNSAVVVPGNPGVPGVVPEPSTYVLMGTGWWGWRGGGGRGERWLTALLRRGPRIGAAGVRSLASCPQRRRDVPPEALPVEAEPHARWVAKRSPTPVVTVSGTALRKLFRQMDLTGCWCGVPDVEFGNLAFLFRLLGVRAGGRWHAAFFTRNERFGSAAGLTGNPRR
jgi:hypothetical protein